jgi:hypothetical protein
MLQNLWNERQELMTAIAEYDDNDDPSDTGLNDLVIRLYDGPERAISQTVPETLDECLILARLLSTKYCSNDFSSMWGGDQDVHLAKSLLVGLERLARN